MSLNERADLFLENFEDFPNEEHCFQRFEVDDITNLGVQARNAYLLENMHDF